LEDRGDASCVAAYEADQLFENGFHRHFRRCPARQRYDIAIHRLAIHDQ
jgi:hypothetical protein